MHINKKIVVILQNDQEFSCSDCKPKWMVRVLIMKDLLGWGLHYM